MSNIEQQGGPSTAPLAGVRVLDLSRVLAGPVCCQVLADLGADVVKVERPGAGDDTRAWGPPFVADGGTSGYFLSANRGKRSLALDLSHASAREIVDGLVARADVLVENFLPDSLERLQLTPARLTQLNPGLVIVSISGFGRTGPLANEPGYDLVIQAAAGLMSITGEPEGQPMKVGVAITDVINGLYAAISALAGLWDRARSGHGRAFDLALFDTTLASLVNVAQSSLLTGRRPQRFGNAHPQIVPYETFATADGHLVLAVGNDAQWRRFCRAVDREDWADDAKYATNPVRVENRADLIPLISKLMGERTTDAWRTLLNAANVPHGPVMAIDEALAHPQTAARRMVHDVEDGSGRSFKILGSPIHESGVADRQPQAPPELGQHSDEVLRDWLGFGPTQIAVLRGDSVIA